MTDGIGAGRPARSPRRRHPARRSRIAAVGVGASSLLGLVAAMGAADALAPAASEPPTPQETARPPAPVSPVAPIVVVVHRSSATGDAVADPAVTDPAVTEAPAASPSPVVLTARPEVRVVTPNPPSAAVAAPVPAPTPPARTSGSR